MDRTPSSSFPLATLWMAIAAVAVSSLLSITQIMLVDWSVVFLLFIRFALVGLVYWILCGLVHRHTWPFFISSMLLWRVFFFVLCQAMVMLYVMHAKLMDATLLFLSSPLWTPCLSWLFFRDSCNRFHLLSVLLGFVGVAWMLHPGRAMISVYVMVGVFSGISNACGQVLAHRLSHEKPLLPILVNVYVYCALVIGLLMGVWHIIHPSWLPMHLGALAASPRSWWLLPLVLVSLFIMGGRLKAYALVVQPTFVMPFIFLAVPFSAVLDWVFYQRMPQAYECWGAAFILSGCMLSIFANHLMARFVRAP